MTPFKLWIVLLVICCLDQPVLLTSINDARNRDIDFDVDIKVPLMKGIDHLKSLIRQTPGDFITPALAGIGVALVNTLLLIQYGFTGIPTVGQTFFNGFSAASTLTPQFLNALAYDLGQLLGFNQKRNGLRELSKRKRHQNRRLG